MCRVRDHPECALWRRGRRTLQGRRRVDRNRPITPKHLQAGRPNQMSSTHTGRPDPELVVRRPVDEVTTSSCPVWQYGPAIGSDGGMASVLDVYSRLPLTRYRFEIVPTWRPDARLWGAGPFTRAISEIYRRGRGRTPLAHVHLSEGGSFVREGAIAAAARSPRCRRRPVAPRPRLRRPSPTPIRASCAACSPRRDAVVALGIDDRRGRGALSPARSRAWSSSPIPSRYRQLRSRPATSPKSCCSVAKSAA